MSHVLRKTIGPWSAGTRVLIESENWDSTYTVNIEQRIKISQEGGIDYEDLVFDIEKEYVVELRNRVDTVPAVSRKQRRELINKLLGGK